MFTIFFSILILVDFARTCQDYFTGTGAITRLPVKCEKCLRKPYESVNQGPLLLIRLNFSLNMDK